MGWLRRRAEQREHEDMRSAYPEEWALGENLANYQFRDLVFVGVDYPGSRREREQFVDLVAPEAAERFKRMRASPSDPLASVAFITAFRARLRKLLGDYARMPAEDQPEASVADVVGAMRPGSAYALVSEARRARLMDDMKWGPLTSWGMKVDVARQALRSAGINADSTSQEAADADSGAFVDLLAYGVFTGEMSLNEALDELRQALPGDDEDDISYREELEEDLQQAAEERERRLRGGLLSAGSIKLTCKYEGCALSFRSDFALKRHEAEPHEPCGCGRWLTEHSRAVHLAMVRGKGEPHP